MTTANPATYAHAVQADLPGGPAFQPCPCAASAAALFDRLHRMAPDLILHRFAAGRLIETTRRAA